MHPEYLIIAFLLLLSICFEGAEAAILSLSDVHLHALVRKGDARAALIEKMKGNTRRLLGTLLLGQKFCDVATASFATVTATKAYGSAGVGIATGIMTLVTLIFMNLIPKSVAANAPERWSLVFAKPLYALTIILGPIVNLIDRFVSLFVPNRDPFAVGEEEIKTMAHMGVKSGSVEKGEHEMIERVFLFNDITASDVLTPREIMVSLDGDKEMSEALPYINSSKFSRYPVYSGKEDNIVGIVHIKDMFERLSETPLDEFARIPLRDLAKPPIFVEETELIDDLFRLCKKERAHMIIVRDKEDRLSGLVTLEDLLEELVGEIGDETDVDEHIIKRVDKHTVLVHGDTEIPDINRFFNLRIPPSEHRTLGRLVMARAGGTPKAGVTTQLDERTTATIELVSKRRILRVRLTKRQD